MTRVRNIVIALVLLLGLGYLGLKGYIHYQVKASLDQAITAAAPMAEIRYDGISSSLRGSVTIQGLTVHTFGDDVRLGELRFGTPNVLVLLSTLSELQRGEAPEFLELELIDLELDLSGPLMNFVQAAVQRQAPRLPTTYPCAGQVVFGPADWRAMGYQRLSSDLRLRLDIDKAAHTVRVQSRWDTQDMGALRVAFEVAGVSASVAQLKESRQAILRWLELDYKDRSYYKRWVKYCAKRDKVDPRSFVAKLVSADATYYMYSWGVVPGDDLRRAYREFLRAPQSVSAVARPSTPLELALVEHYTPDDLVALLDLRVVVNGHGVPSSQVSYRPELLGKYAAAPAPALQWPPVAAPQAAAPARSQPPVKAATSKRAAAPEAADRKARTQPVRPQPAAPRTAETLARTPPPAAKTAEPQRREFGYRRVAREGLDRYVGRYVRVLTGDGTEREGVLSEVRGTEVVVERRMYGGSLAVPVSVSEIDRIEVWLPRDS